MTMSQIGETAAKWVTAVQDHFDWSGHFAAVCRQIHFYFNPKHDFTNTIEVTLIATTQPDLNHSVAAA